LFAYKFTGKERDTESGLDYFGARYYASSMGRFMSPDPILIMRQKMTDPQQWNMYSYVRNNPLRMVDTNGKWPTDIHNAIINGAFGGLSASQRVVLQTASKRVDGYLNGGQTAALAYEHGMRAPGQSKEEARGLADKFIAGHEAAATGLARANGGVNDAALNELGTALHTVSDRTSPAHMGEQVWTGGGERLLTATKARLSKSQSPAEPNPSVPESRKDDRIKRTVQSQKQPEAT
jgi:RHS repeat-associated protein